MARYMLMGDIHLSDTPPSSCTPSYQDDIFSILWETSTIAARMGVRGVIWAGDIFHHKTPGRTSHRTVSRLIRLAQSYPCPVHVVPGNHDMSNDRIESIDETQPLGVLLASGAVQLLAGWMLPTDTDLDETDHSGWLPPVYGVPWLQRFDDDTVGDALADYRGEEDNYTDHCLVVAHAPLYPPGQELKFEHYPTPAWADAMGNTGSVYYGHVHEAHLTYTTGGITFCNPGAISRGSLHEHNLSRKVSVAVWDSETGEFEIVEVPHKPADEVFLLEAAAQAKDGKLNFDAFLSQIATTRVSTASLEAVIAQVRQMALDPELEKVLITLLEAVA
jgi:predicted phosphodiesterase